MNYDSDRHSGRLKRIDPQCYRGRQWVHWVMTINQRRTGWLAETHHFRLRELLCHALAREDLICPAYCLMPDHGHFLLGGLGPNSDQKNAVKILRREWNRILKKEVPSCELQIQAFDHVLSEAERERETFGSIAGYILQNPCRAGLVASYKDWPYLGAVGLGYPSLDPRDEEFYPLFWRIYDRLVNPQ